MDNESEQDNAPENSEGEQMTSMITSDVKSILMSQEAKIQMLIDQVGKLDVDDLNAQVARANARADVFPENDAWCPFKAVFVGGNTVKVGKGNLRVGKNFYSWPNTVNGDVDTISVGSSGDQYLVMDVTVNPANGNMDSASYYPILAVKGSSDPTSVSEVIIAQFTVTSGNGVALKQHQQSDIYMPVYKYGFTIQSTPPYYVYGDPSGYKHWVAGWYMDICTGTA